MRHEDGELRVVGIGGTLREGSTSLRALEKALAAAKLNPDAGAVDRALLGVA